MITTLACADTYKEFLSWIREADIKREECIFVTEARLLNNFNLAPYHLKVIGTPKINTAFPIFEAEIIRRKEEEPSVVFC